MKHSIYRPFIIILSVALLFGACSREFDDNDDYQYNQIEPVLGDNVMLYSKIFRNKSTGTYLWFDLRNEIANFSKPIVSVSFLQNSIDRYTLTDLRGRIYEYNKDVEEVTFLNIPLNLFGKGEQSADLICTLARKQKDSCDDLTDESKKEECKRTYGLALKRIEISEIDATLTIGEPYTYQNSTVILTAQTEQELYLTN